LREQIVLMVALTAARDAHPDISHGRAVWSIMGVILLCWPCVPAAMQAGSAVARQAHPRGGDLSALVALPG